MTIISAALLAVLLWGATKILSKLVHQPRPQYPPGPKPKPFIGNALDIPLANAAQRYMAMGRKYNSGILHLEALGNHVIVLNTVEDADELLEKRASNYSDRPTVPMIKLMGWEHVVALLPHNDEWRLHRRICQQNFRQAESSKYFPLINQKVHEMLQGLLETPQEFDQHIKMMSVAIPLSSMYGYDINSLDDPCIKAADESTTMGSTLLLPGNNFVDIFPALGRIPAWVPGTTAVRSAAYVKRVTEEMKRIPTEYVQKRFTEGKAIPSLVTDMLEKKFVNSVSKEEEEAVKNIAYTVYGGASDTTIALTKAFFYYMAINPNIQAKAQSEIDRAVGSQRLPSFEDRKLGKMPYIEAIYRELLRMAAPLPLCVPHAVSEDDYYKGYFIPKGATVLVNIWGMTHDEKQYPDPFVFKPERFLDDSGQLYGEDKILAYGFGRRVCVGKYIGSSTVWLVIASVLACFNIDKAKQQNGEYFEIDDEFEEFGIVRHKAKFACSFNARTTGARKLVLNSVLG